jgi:two-component system nitrogen regulation sensor histidine kinase NtrY
MASSSFAVGVGARAALLGGICFAVLQLLVAHEFYATACVLALVGLVLLAELARYIARTDRLLGDFFDALAAQDFQRPLPPRGFGMLEASLGRATHALRDARASRQRRIDYLHALLDEVSAALFVLSEDGTGEPVNRAAGRLAARAVHRLHDIVAIGPESAARLEAIAPGETLVIRLRNGQRALAFAAHFASGGASRRLVSLQNIESELDAAELKAWRDLVRILAHEMMNSLTPVVSLADSVRPLLSTLGQGTPVVQDITVAIDTIARRSAGLMSFVERYRKMADLPQPTPRHIVLVDVIGRIRSLMVPALAQKGIELTTQIEPSELEAHADAELLEQALINLLHNAVDAVAAVSEPRIGLTCRARGDHILIEVSDNGRGLDPATLDQIFVPFFTTKPGGSGIGLALARQIALAHRGQVEVAPRAGGGAVFSLVLPARM